jgi:hypothetical protein
MNPIGLRSEIPVRVVFSLVLPAYAHYLSGRLCFLLLSPNGAPAKLCLSP